MDDSYFRGTLADEINIGIGTPRMTKILTKSITYRIIGAIVGYFAGLILGRILILSEEF
ncbi:MAG: hypothetical protein JWQ38_3758 [Flavipsychrobacter sp.]|nr:hypothetical protein [Flavipsychrobacter sp.]